MTPDPRGAASSRRSAATRIRIGLIVAAYVALTVWWLWPLPVQLADHATYPDTPVAEVSADFHLITWALAWDTHALLTQPRALFDANIFYPVPRALAFSEHFLGYVPLFAPTYLLSGNAILASNVLLFATFPLCALAMYALARRFVPDGAAFLAGGLFAFCGLRYQNLYHFHQLGTFYVPAALLFTERWLERARTGAVLALATVIALQLLSSFYLGYALLLLYAAYLPLALWRWRAALDRRRIVGLGLALAASLLPALLASLPYLEMQRLGLVPSARGAETSALFTMEPRFTMLQVRHYLTEGGVGLVGYVLGAVALLRGWRGGGHARAVALLACLLGLLLACGLRVQLFGVALWSPYALLFRWLPGFAAIRLPFRFLVVAQLGFALLAALGLTELCRRLPQWLSWPVAVAALVAALAVAPARAPHVLHAEQVGARQPPVYRWLREHGDGGALLELPVGDAATSSRRMVLGTEHWLPMIDGYSAYPPLTRNYLRRLAARLPEPDALQRLIDSVDLGWIVVHLDELDELDEAARRVWAKGHVAGLELVERWNDELLFKVTLPVADDRRALLVSTTRTLDGNPLAPVATPCTGSLQVLVLDDRAQFPPGAKLKLGVQVANASAGTWPGLGFYPRYLVQFAAAFRSDGKLEGLPTIAPLWVDIPAGETVPVLTEVTAPTTPGAYELELGLVQDGKPLEACGLTAARLGVRVIARPAAAKRSP